MPKLLIDSLKRKKGNRVSFTKDRVILKLTQEEWAEVLKIVSEVYNQTIQALKEIEDDHDSPLNPMFYLLKEREKRLAGLANDLAYYQKRTGTNDQKES